MVVLKALFVASALTFTVTIWLYAYLVPTVSTKVERILGFLWIASCLSLAAISTIVALSHI
jgi:hypothetical protein